MTLWCCGLDGLGLLLGALLCVRLRRRGVSPVRQVLWLTGFTGMLLAVAMLGTGWWETGSLARPNAFTLLRVLCHAAFCVLAPLGVWHGIALIRRRRTMGELLVGSLLAGLGAVSEGVYLYAREVAPYRLQITHHDIVSPRLDGLDRPIRIVAVADVQTEAIAAYEERVAQAIVAEHPDLIVLLGDYVQRFKDEAPQYEAELLRFRAWVRSLGSPRLGVYAVDGDVEWRVDALGDAARHLTDEAVRLPVNVPVQLLGLSMPRSHRTLSGDLGRRLLDFDGYSIVIGHAPDYMLWTLDDGHEPDALMLAGHCHGGQLALPGFGPLFTLSAIPRRLAWGEVWQRGGTTLRVSRGVGHEQGQAPPLRLFSAPEIVVLDLAGERPN